MATPYNGVATNIGDPSGLGATSTIPSDTDQFNAASEDIALQKLTDYVTATLSSIAYSVLTFAGAIGNTASTKYYLGVGGLSGALAPTGASPPAAFSSTGGIITLTLPMNIVVRYIIFGWGTTNANSITTIGLYTGAGVSVGLTNALAAGTIGPGTVSFVPQTGTGYVGFSIAAATGWGVMVQNGVGTTTGIGNCVAHVLYTLG